MKSILYKLGFKKQNNQGRGDDIEQISSGVGEGQLAVDIYHNDDEIVVIAPMAGVDIDDVSITVDDDVLTIKGTRETPPSDPDAEFYVQECFWGSFSRSIILPVAADADKIAATFDDSVLVIRIPKERNAKRRVVKIKTIQ